MNAEKKEITARVNVVGMDEALEKAERLQQMLTEINTEIESMRTMRSATRRAEKCVPKNMLVEDLGKERTNGLKPLKATVDLMDEMIADYKREITEPIPADATMVLQLFFDALYKANRWVNTEQEACRAIRLAIDFMVHPRLKSLVEHALLNSAFEETFLQRL